MLDYHTVTLFLKLLLLLPAAELDIRIGKEDENQQLNTVNGILHILSILGMHSFFAAKHFVKISHLYNLVIPSIFPRVRTIK